MLAESNLCSTNTVLLQTVVQTLLIISVLLYNYNLCLVLGFSQICAIYSFTFSHSSVLGNCDVT
jgi:hypothetical protein